MEVKNTVTASVRSTVRNGFELLVISFAILLPLALTAFATLDTSVSRLETFTCGAVGTLIWWYLCWCIFWLII